MLPFQTLTFTALAFTLATCATLAQPGANPTYSSQVEERINRIVHNLQPNSTAAQSQPGKSLIEQLKHYKTPGVSIAVINEGRVEWARGFGFRDSAASSPVNIYTLFQAASLSKPITAMAVMRLKERTLLD